MNANNFNIEIWDHYGIFMLACSYYYIFLKIQNIIPINPIIVARCSAVFPKRKITTIIRLVQ